MRRRVGQAGEGAFAHHACQVGPRQIENVSTVRDERVDRRCAGLDEPESKTGSGCLC